MHRIFIAAVISLSTAVTGLSVIPAIAQDRGQDARQAATPAVLRAVTTGTGVQDPLLHQAGHKHGYRRYHPGPGAYHDRHRYYGHVPYGHRKRHYRPYHESYPSRGYYRSPYWYRGDDRGRGYHYGRPHHDRSHNDK